MMERKDRIFLDTSEVGSVIIEALETIG